MNIQLTRFIFLVFALFLSQACTADEDKRLSKLSVPDGFKISVYADDLPNARTMVMGDNGIIFVGTRGNGSVYAIKDINKDGRIQKAIDFKLTLNHRFNMPNGLVFHQGDLYIADIDKLYRFKEVEKNLNKSPLVIRDDLPSEQAHGWRYMGLGPDERLYIAIGAPCNNCLEKGFAQIRSMKLDGSDEKVIAEGIRNSVGFTWHPQTKQLWATDNGRDSLGDDIPADEILLIDRAGKHFGYPFCHGGNVIDPEFGRKGDCNKYEQPAYRLGAHVAPLGIHFYQGQQFPKAYQRRAFIAEHGSWNRSSKVGYSVMMATIENNKVIDYQPFITGWLENEQAWGRPAYFLELADGSLLVSDDRAGIIYRVSYRGK